MDWYAIESQLRNKGFNVQVSDMSLIVSLNRKIDTTEVKVALDYNEDITLTTTGNSVIVF